ncbi:MAG: hypothetical protein A2X82_00635 [Geobacteraceae bacterium GWC2_55_20]|nr:MAG: hypothetical protein A2X82_00635 [Geobacteraceae bacterium GWC2_55_20]OGU18780.1 MAG: hypothetical protein A2X85_08925 [Geobacteraceae bacterium GWF2_54_21]HBA71211.1 hypothetical protein [Geobacter sp.]
MEFFNTIAGMASIASLLLAIATVGGGFIYFKLKKKSNAQKIKGNNNIQAGRDVKINGGGRNALDK